MNDGEEQYNANAHKNLLKAISNLGKTQHIRRATRNEPLLQQPNEFNLVKGISKASTTRVAANDIVQVLRRTKDHLDAGKQLKNVQSTKKVLSQPLEKPVAQRIKRNIGYDKTKEKLRRWDAIVARNRTAEQQVFPLPEETVYIDTRKYTKPVQLSVKSDLMVEMELVEAKLRGMRKERAGDFENEEVVAKREQEQLKTKLTRDELKARRKELTYLKMRESQQSAKARLKNKIKSKKYHKLLKKQKLQEQVKEFELLQKTNPDAALEKLNLLEKNRMLERANLRHKNTGAWAKNLQVRAKYNKEVRKDLAEALQKSRELTLKKDIEDVEQSEEYDEERESRQKVSLMEDDPNFDIFNPWTRANSANTNKIDDFEQKENWRKYWLLRNENEKTLQKYTQEQKDLDAETSVESSEDISNGKKDINKKRQIKKSYGLAEKIKKDKNIKASAKSINVDDIFDEHENKIQSKFVAKIRKMHNNVEKIKGNASQLKNDQKHKIEEDELKNLKDLSFKHIAKHVIIDEELSNQKEGATTLISPNVTKATIDHTNISTKRIEITDILDTIDPTKVAEIKLNQHIGHFNTLDEAIEEADFDEKVVNTDTLQQITINEAFEDDDIIADFSRDKINDSDMKNTEMQLAMPGWGSWAGAGLRQKTLDGHKRFILNLADRNIQEMAKRRDNNKNGVYINEMANKKMRIHLVSDVPFPFTSAQEYEASIRAPIGRNYMPETAFRAFTRPSIITKKGTIIKPMDEMELVKPVRRPRHVVDKRIAEIHKVIKKTGKK